MSFEYDIITSSGSRETNEDRILEPRKINLSKEDYIITGIFDGHGGSEAVDYVLNNFLEILNKYNNTEDIYNSIKLSLVELENYTLANKLESGSTILLLLLSI